MLLKKSLEDYRKGAIGSILDEYEKALSELKFVIQNVSEADYLCIIQGESEHCHSIEVIMNHVVRAGYGYSKYIRDELLMKANPIADRRIPQTEIRDQIDQMFVYTCEIFEGERQITDDEMENIHFKTRWSESYNIDQLLEHAIVHILRHRRQIEKFILKFEN